MFNKLAALLARNRAKWQVGPKPAQMQYQTIKPSTGTHKQNKRKAAK